MESFKLLMQQCSESTYFSIVQLREDILRKRVYPEYRFYDCDDDDHVSATDDDTDESSMSKVNDNDDDHRRRRHRHLKS